MEVTFNPEKKDWTVKDGSEEHEVSFYMDGNGVLHLVCECDEYIRSVIGGEVDECVHTKEVMPVLVMQRMKGEDSLFKKPEET